jgi:hypothetical protein
MCGVGQCRAKLRSGAVEITRQSQGEAEVIGIFSIRRCQRSRAL